MAYWTDEHVDSLTKLCMKNAPWERIMGEFGERSKDSLEKKIRRLGLPMPSNEEVYDENEAIYIEKHNAFLWGVMFCQHRPMHDQRALSVTHKIFKAAGINGLWNGGDLVDLGAVSYFSDSRDMSADLQYEFDDLQRAWDWEDKFYHGQLDERVWQDGNHEFRLYSYIRDNSPGLRSLRCLSLDELAGVEDHGITRVHGPAIMADDSFVLKHGVATGEYAGKKEIEKEGRSGMCSHNHRVRIHTRAERNRRPKYWYHGGCLMQLPPQYAKKEDWMNWQQCCNLVMIDGDNVHVEQIPIYNGQAFWGGKLFTAD